VIEKNNLRILVVDDEKPARRDIIRILGKVKDVEIVGEAGDGREAVELMDKTKPDIVLLDIQMPGLDGFQVIEALPVEEPLPLIIFVTAYDEYALKAFEVHAVDYLLKPVDEKRLLDTIERVRRVNHMDANGPDIKAMLESLEPHRGRLVVNCGDRLVALDLDDVFYATISAGDVIVAGMEIEGRTSYKSLDELQSELPSDKFIRVHRSYLANIGRIYEILPRLGGSYNLKMGSKSGPVIPLSRSRAKELRKILKW
jgi:two-component system response regulator LytT